MSEKFVVVGTLETPKDYDKFLQTWKDKPKQSKVRRCRDCGVELGRNKHLCEDCRSKQVKRHKEKYLAPPHHCRECGVEIPTKSTLCSACRVVVYERQVVKKREAYRLGIAAQKKQKLAIDVG
jgi:predicted nucleic acid-binding Zn ribbon protein